MNSYSPVRTSTSAIVSLVFGVLSWVALPLIGALVAIIAGHMARAEIRRAAGALEGDGMAIAGLLLGYIQLAMIMVALAMIFLVFGGIAALAIFSGG
ncbi:MAG TPA: DUF4190 domain-containing protein [Xanthomonadaceae bacterium]|nr:DUF4190 domain-containing protein [Xanthomonadaceae bacterium]